MAFAAVDVQRAVEVAGLTVDVDVQRVERCTALAERLAHHLGGGIEHVPQLPTGEFLGDACTVDAGPPQRLVGVDIADTRHHRLIEELAFDLRVLAAQHRYDGITVESRIQGVACNVCDGPGHRAAVHADQIGQLPTAECALINEAQRGAVIERRRDPQMFGSIEWSQQHLTTHPQMHHQRHLGSEREPQILSAPVRPGDVRTDQPCGEVGGTGFVTANRTRVAHLNRGDRPAGDMRLQAPAHHLDFRKFRHPDRRLPRRPRQRRRHPAQSRPGPRRWSPRSSWTGQSLGRTPRRRRTPPRRTAVRGQAPAT